MVYLGEYLPDILLPDFPLPSSETLNNSSAFSSDKAFEDFRYPLCKNGFTLHG